MNKTTRGIGVVGGFVLIVAVIYISGKEAGDRDRATQSSAILHLEMAGYHDIKIVDTGYLMALPLPRDANTHATTALDFIVVEAVKDGKTTTVKVSHAGLPTMTIEQF